jgi:manganese/zinc/iron transport system permease protein
VLGLPVRRLDLVLLALLVASVVAGMQVAGIVLVVAMIVAPAATARLLPGSLTTVIALAASIGAGCAVCGVLLSLRYESLPTGSAMTLCAGALFMLTTLVLAGRRWRGATPSTPADAAGRAGA